MEEKDSTVFGSMSDSGTDSPSPVTSFAASTAVATTEGETSPPEPPSNNNVTSTNVTGSGPVTPFSGSMTSPVGTTTAIPVAAEGSNGGDMSGKRKRGRPRKYDAEGNLIVRSPPPTENLAKKNRSKGFGTGELFERTAGEDFTPHIITVNTGEDLTGKILSFTQKGPRGICVLSAIGTVSNVRIRHPGSAGGILTYEGLFEILTLTGSYVITEIGGIWNKTGGLSVSLAGPDGRVIGGVVDGVLTASSPIQVVIGSFLTFGAKPQKRKYKRRSSVVTPALPSADVVSTGQVPETKPKNEPLQSENAESSGWNNSEPEQNRVISPEINVSDAREIRS
ncbi:PREDICTED: AT-hook motif nuclear-localized protein 7-like isoform X2 [Tarenaya hassleriana]|uniref:AT-hook motif nuclear-localized protein 7-like isoform X2 n=1 Tax=Tarenaya hassleriana TaxID=28532 RepID=UPI00053C9255|nr:PREDICTED: AT-hook motif nuclear-localized protein 7-like isoform X2 [Tarenaya hassleriana]